MLNKFGICSLSAQWKYSFIQIFTITYYALGPACFWGLIRESQGLFHLIDVDLSPSTQYYPGLSFDQRRPGKSGLKHGFPWFSVPTLLYYAPPTIGKGPWCPLNKRKEGSYIHHAPKKNVCVGNDFFYIFLTPRKYIHTTLT